MTDWFRSWHGAPTDSKWLLIGRRVGVAPGIVSAIWWAVLDHASQASERGKVDDFDVETYAAFSGFEESQITAVLKAFSEKKLIVNGWLISWEKRQPNKEDPGAAERKRQQRSRSVTPCHAASHDVTLDKSREEQNREEQIVPFPNGNGQPAAAKPLKDDPWKRVYDRGKAILGKEAGGLITKLRKLYDDKPSKVLAKIEDAGGQREPLAWLNAFLWKVDDGGRLAGEYIGGVPP